MSDSLARSGAENLEQIEQVRQSRQSANAQTRRDRPSAKTFVAVDAEQGLVILEDADSGIAPVQNQGSLSVGAVSEGEAVRSDWDSVDWPQPASQPAQSKSAALASDIDQAQARADADAQSVDDPDAASGSAPPPAPYCSTQCFWYRGSPPAQGSTYQESRGFSWDMSAGPMSKTYAHPIVSIESLGGTWDGGGGAAAENLPCPSPVSFSGNTIYDDFDPAPGIYSNNQGTCAYTVTLLVEAAAPAADPGRWRRICSSAPPLRTDYAVNGDRTVITVWDQATSFENPLAQIGLETGRYSVATRCQELGPP